MSHLPSSTTIPFKSIIGFIAVTSLASAADPTKYCGSDMMFSQEELVEFLIDHLDISYSKLRAAPGKDPTQESKLANANVSAELRRLHRLYGPLPYTVDQIHKAFGPQPLKPLDAWESRPPWAKITPLTSPWLKQEIEYSTADQTGTSTRRFEGDPGEVLRAKAAAEKDQSIRFNDAPDSKYEASWGPIRLRKDVGSLMDYNLEAMNWSKWTTLENESFKNESKELKTVEGIKIGYKDDRNTSGSGAWSTEGAIIMPFHLMTWPGQDSLFYHAGLATSWKLEEQEIASDKEINELKFSAPMGLYFASGFGQVFAQAEPYYQTDTGFDGAIHGITASLEYADVDTIGYYKYLASIGERSLNVRFRARGIFDYSDVTSTSEFMKRTKNDDWLRIGTKISLDLGLFDEKSGTLQPITLTTSYQFLDGLSGVDSGYNSLFKTSLNFWLNEYAAISAEYQKGETPVASKDVDMISLGLQLRY